MKKKHGKKNYQPYAPIKMKFFEIGDPFGDVPVAVRQAAVREAAAKARASFDIEYPKLANWFDTHDPLYVLSFCAFYFLTTQQGVDKEAIEGKWFPLDSADHYL